SGNNMNAASFTTLKTNGSAFAIAKSSQGRTPDSPAFSNYYNWIKDARLIRGSYHFFSNRHSTAPVFGSTVEQQANTVIDLVKRLAPGDLAPALDLEDEPRLPNGNPSNAGRFPLEQGIQPGSTGYHYRHIAGNPNHGAAGLQSLLADVRDFLNRLEKNLG